MWYGRRRSLLGNRSIYTILRSVFQRRHYLALWNMYWLYPEFRENFRRYFMGRGAYPYRIRISTPIGLVRPILYNKHDLLTVNEIFCRLDYWVDDRIDVIVDLGSNIGISALYFLTRNHTSRCYLFEPDSRNTQKLKQNLTGFEPRYVLREDAVGNRSGRLTFGIESTGRYGGIGIEAEDYVEVDCLNINDVLRAILTKERVIDLLKIDTEGMELAIIKAIKHEHLKRIRRIYLEGAPEEKLHPVLFKQHQYGSVCQLISRRLSS